MCWVQGFLEAVGGRGMGALELVAMDMKARGMYVCRTLSFKGQLPSSQSAVLRKHSPTRQVIKGDQGSSRVNTNAYALLWGVAAFAKKCMHMPKLCASPNCLCYPFTAAKSGAEFSSWQSAICWGCIHCDWSLVKRGTGAENEMLRQCYGDEEAVRGSSRHVAEESTPAAAQKLTCGYP